MLNELYEKTKMIKTKTTDTNHDVEKSIEQMQKIIDKLSMVLCGFGTEYMDDLLFISFGIEYTNIKTNDFIIKEKYDLLRRYVHPIGYKILHWKSNRVPSEENQLCCNKTSDTTIIMENANMFECFDVDMSNTNFYQKIYGVRIIIQNETLRKTMIITGIVDDIQVECFSNQYIDKRLETLYANANGLENSEKDIFCRIISSLTFKDMLILGDDDIYKKIFTVRSETTLTRSRKLDMTIKQFLEMNLYDQRNLLVHLLINNNDYEIQYISYLLYDLISVNSFDNIDTTEQVMIYDSLPWKIKTYFKDAIKCGIKYTHDMIQKYDINKISLEQQIYLLNVNENVKERAMIKLKEVKNKSDEMGNKARQYLEGLIKIPFGIYKEEGVLRKMKELNEMFSKLLDHCIVWSETIPKKEKYTVVELIKYIQLAHSILSKNASDYIVGHCKDLSLKQISTVLYYIYNSTNRKLIKVTSHTKDKYINELIAFIQNPDTDRQAIIDVYDLMKTKTTVSYSRTFSELSLLKTNVDAMEHSMKHIRQTLDNSIYGHEYAKNQIVKIIAQWMNGEQSGYSFGFEGSPGIGKTSLAKKGLANCLHDENGISRPYSFIALGGSSNASLLEGHGYTYINSTWGKIADILMDSKCMNPIIYIDELDKVSKTDQGREIIGILTHLIDPTQNDTFQDKYFSGIHLDLSKALFIFSYNDAEQIDKILLDRIHRIKFDNLELDDKVVIVKKYILPEINKKMGLENIVTLSDNTIISIIENYTCEPGVRKLKEILFDLFGEINIELLDSKNSAIDLPLEITNDLLEHKYLKKYTKTVIRKIHTKPKIGIINGLWANSLGKGGITPIETMFFPSATFLELKLTGLQGDVMKESMNVAKTLAWSLTPIKTQQKWIHYFETTKHQGIHVHCPEGAVSKDGPSAGAAITIAMFSLFNEKPIKNNIAMTGEITLQGNITIIGGLEHKIYGGIQNGVNTFLYPRANKEDMTKFLKQYETKEWLHNITFYEVDNIEDVFQYVF
jgi:ATP-dependent Lon protease